MRVIELVRREERIFFENARLFKSSRSSRKQRVMRKIELLLIVGLLACGLLPQRVIASQTTGSILFVLGYSDYHEEYSHYLPFQSYEYWPYLHLESHNQILEYLHRKGFEVEPTNQGLGLRSWDRWQIGEMQYLETYVHPVTSQKVDILNPNVFCTDQELDAVLMQLGLLPLPSIDYVLKRGSLIRCRALWQNSREGAQYLRSHLTSYETVIFLGHARAGQGMDLGPYLDENSLVKWSDIDLAASQFVLRRVFMATCDSNKYFKKQVLRLAPEREIEFFGLDGELLWLEEMLPSALHFLDSQLIRPEKGQ